MKRSRTRRNHKTVVLFIGIFLLLILVVTQKHDIQQSFDALHDAKQSYVVLALLFSALSFLPAALVYVCIAMRRLSYKRTLLVQIASSFTNRLLPAGAGGLVTFARYLIKVGHSPQQAAAIVSVNNILGFIATIVLSVAVALLSRTPLHEVLRVRLPSFVPWIIIGVLCVSLAILALSATVRKRSTNLIRDLTKDFRLIAANPLRLTAGLLASILITLCYAAVLYVSIRAMGQSATMLQTFIVLIVGVAAASITPTPGGIGGAEAGLVGALSSIGISPLIGLDIALIYRVATFWLPIIPGVIVFRLTLIQKIL